MNKLYTLIFCAFFLISCSDNLSEDHSPNSPDLDFINAKFSYVNGINQYGVPADSWAKDSEIAFYYISDSESGKPQGRVIWNFPNDEKSKKAWWRFDPKKNVIAIFGEGGTAGFLALTDLHIEVKRNWRTLYINEQGHLIMDETTQDPIQWELYRLTDSPKWKGE